MIIKTLMTMAILNLQDTAGTGGGGATTESAPAG